jgi:hypothetical protein
MLPCLDSRPPGGYIRRDDGHTQEAEIMSHRQKQHHGRSEGDERELEGRDVSPGDLDLTEIVSSESVVAAEEAREISRILDENEGYNRPQPRSAAAGGAPGRKTRRKPRG